MSDTMARPGYRLTIDLTDLRDRIEAARPGDLAWAELSLGGKVRALLNERLQEIEQDAKGGKDVQAQ